MKVEDSRGKALQIKLKHHYIFPTKTQKYDIFARERLSILFFEEVTRQISKSSFALLTCEYNCHNSFGLMLIRKRLVEKGFPDVILLDSVFEEFPCAQQWLESNFDELCNTLNDMSKNFDDVTQYSPIWYFIRLLYIIIAQSISHLQLHFTNS